MNAVGLAQVGAFMLTSVFLVLLHNRERAPHSLIDQGPASSQQTPGPAPQQPAAPSSEQAPGQAPPQPQPEKPAEPSPPLAR